MSKKIILILLYLAVISSFLMISMGSNNSLLGYESCDTVGCHNAPSSIGHVAFSVVLTGAQTVQTGSSATITATIKNSGYPLDQVSLTLETSSFYSISGSASKNVGNVGRNAQQSETWTLNFHASSAQSAVVTVDFSGQAYAASHMQYTFSGSQYTYSKSVYIVTTPIPILKVDSTPLPETSIFVGSSNTSGNLVIQNAGKVDMKDVSVVTSGAVLVNNQTSFTIADIPALSQVSYPIKIDTSKTGEGTITVTYLGTFKQQSVINIYLIQNPANSFTLFLGRLFGYIAYVLLFLSVVAGAGIYHLKKYISGRKIRILHSDLANLSFTMVLIHAIILTIPNSPWANNYLFFELLPERIPTDIGSLGLALGRSALVLMYISVFSGYYLAKLIKRYGKRVGISIHMLSYIALIFGFLHTIILGGWAHEYPIIGVILFISILSVGFLKFDAQRMLNRKKKEHEMRLAQRALKAAQETVSTES